MRAVIAVNKTRIPQEQKFEIYCASFAPLPVVDEDVEILRNGKLAALGFVKSVNPEARRYTIRTGQ
jgi:hypothetical protein